MKRIVIDTNVIVSALISEGIPADIISKLVLEKKVLLCTSDSVLEEYSQVLSREKFIRYKNFKINAEIIINRLDEIAMKYSPNIKLNLISDEPDNRFLELAVFAKVDYLITGNSNDFTEKKYADVNIVTPREFWDQYSK